jgi:iron complex outermembrane recepter protein
VRRSSLQPVAGDPWTGPSEQISQPPTAFIPNGTRILDDGTTDVESRALSAEFNWELPFATLTFIPAVRNVDIAYLTYTPAFRFDTTEGSEQQSYELRLGNTSERLNWVGGFYYFDEDQTELYFLNANPIQQSNVDVDLNNESWAAFGQGTFSLTDTLRLIGGVRYTEEDKEQSGQTIATLPVAAITNNAGQRSFDDVSWKAGVEYDVAPDSMLFFTAATGFKAGGFFPSVQAPNNSYEPEELLAYTLGLRNRFLDRRLQVNVETFYWDYEDKQERFLSVTTAGTTGLLTTNAGAATLYGANLDVEFRATPNDLLRFSVEYLNSEYDEFSYMAYNPNGGSYPAEATGCVLGTAVPLPTSPNPIDTVQPIDCAGQDLVRAPEWSGVAGYDHIFDFGNGSRLVTGVNTTFSSSQILSPDFIPSGTDDGYATANADITFFSRDDRWSLSAWGRNLTDEEIYTGGFRYPFSRPVAQGGDPTLFYPNIRAPRTYGVRFNVQF